MTFAYQSPFPNNHNIQVRTYPCLKHKRMTHKHQERVLLLPTNESCIHYYNFGVISCSLGVFEIYLLVIKLDLRNLLFHANWE